MPIKQSKESRHAKVAFAFEYFAWMLLFAAAILALDDRKVLAATGGGDA